MNSSLKLATAVGMLDVALTIDKFAQRIPDYIMERDNIVVPKLHYSNSVDLFSSGLLNSSELKNTITSETHKLNKVLKVEINRINFIAEHNEGKVIADYIKNAIIQFKKQELLNIIINTPCKFFTKTITLEKIHQLSTMMIQNNYESDHAFLTKISDTQQFFNILNPYDFKFYYNISDKYHLADRDAYRYNIRAKLVNIGQNNVFTFRYFEGNIMTDMYESRLYVQNPQLYGVISNVVD